MAEEKVAIVTGGGGGVGRATALALSAAGWRVVVAGRREPALAETARSDAAGRIVAVVADVVDAVSVDALFAETVRRFVRLDLLFNNAGINNRAVPLDELPAEEIRAVLDTNLLGSMLCARAAFRVMKTQQQQGGRIINNGSVSAYGPRPHSAPYAASKHAITGLTKSLALDGRPFNIACGQIDIGNAATDMSAYMAAGALQADGTTRSEPRIPADDVAAMVVHMASLPLSENVSFVTLMATAMPLYGRG